MLSIIICSRHQEISSILRSNIKNTVGIDYELIVIDNSENEYSIFEAYNQGMDQSKGELLCYLHEDILIHTNNWGNILIELFRKDSLLGIVGIAGSKMKTKSPSGWWNCPQNFRSANLIQHLDKGNKEHWNYGFENYEEELVVVDGVFMALRRDSRITFNEHLKGFHNYDLSIGIDYKKKGYKVVATNQILIEHFSMGRVDARWYKEALKFDKLYNNSLPLSTSEVSNSTLKRQEYSNRYIFIEGLLSHNLVFQAFLQWLKLILEKPMARKNFSILNSFFK